MRECTQEEVASGLNIDDARGLFFDVIQEDTGGCTRCITGLL